MVKLAVRCRYRPCDHIYSRYIEKHYSHVLTVMQAKELRTNKFKAKA